MVQGPPRVGAVPTLHCAVFVEDYCTCIQYLESAIACEFGPKVASTQTATGQHFDDNRGYMPLEIAFQTRELRATCESPTRAKRELGEPASKALRRALADMNAVETAAELLEMGLGVENCAQELGVLRFQLSGGLILYCHVNQQSVPMNGEEIDWAQVTRLKVVRIGSDK